MSSESNIVLHFAPGTCARVPLIALEEIGLPFETQLVAFMAGDHRKPAFLARNPAGKVPVLEVGDVVLSQNTAILTYLARRFPAARLLPVTDNPLADAQLLSRMVWFSADLHPIVTRIRMPHFFCDRDGAPQRVRQLGMDAMRFQLGTLERDLAGQPWVLGEHWSVLDAYLFWVWFRITGAGFDEAAFPAIAAHHARMNERPATQRALAREAAAQQELAERGLAIPPRLNRRADPMSFAPIRRIVTGHDPDGKAIVQEDGPPSRIQRVGGVHGPLFYEIWNTREAPARIDRSSAEPIEDGISLVPPKNGTRIRILDIPPDDASLETLTPEQARAHFAEVGALEASSHAGAASRHAFMHKTETVDYGIMLEGELTLIMDEDETVIRPGDIVIQRGTNHGWANRSGKPCRICFVLIDGAYQDGLK